METKLTLKMEEKLLRKAQTLAKIKGVDRSQILRDLIHRGLEEEKLWTAVDLYKRGETMEYAANLTHTNLWDLIEFMHKHNITRNFDAEQDLLLYAKILEADYPELSKKILDI